VEDLAVAAQVVPVAVESMLPEALLQQDKVMQADLVEAAQVTVAVVVALAQPERKLVQAGKAVTVEPA
jgi:CRISPR/Cas system-associated exonuclease Cas4 (RecB family)